MHTNMWTFVCLSVCLYICSLAEAHILRQPSFVNLRCGLSTLCLHYSKPADCVHAVAGMWPLSRQILAS